MYSLDDFIAIIRELIAFFDNMAITQKQKLDAAIKQDVVQIEECMKKEQAEVLRFRGLDKRRCELQAALHFQNLSLKEILPLVEKNRNAECNALFDRLDDSVKLYRSAFNSAKLAIETNLYRVNSALAASSAPKQNAGVYSASGQTKTPSASGRFTSRQV